MGMLMFDSLKKEVDSIKKTIAEFDEKLDSWKCFFDDDEADDNALIYLSHELSRLGYRDLDPSSCKAAIKAIEKLTKELNDARQA